MTTAPDSGRHDLQIGGMTCASCVSRVEAALSGAPGVRQVSVNLVTERATFTLDPGRGALGEVEAAVRDAGYTVRRLGGDAGDALADEAADDRRERRDLLIAATLTVPLVALAMAHGSLPGTDGPWVPWVQMALATPVVVGPGARFFRAGWAAARHGAPDMNTLVALGAGAAWFYSVLALLIPGFSPHSEHGAMAHIYFEASGAIITFVLLGKLLEGRAKRRLSDAVRGLVALQPASVTRLLPNGDERAVSVDGLRVGWRVRARPGERIAADGVVDDGASAVDESMLTGESMPVDKQPGDEVFAGTINGAGALVVRVVREASDTALARIVAAVEQAQGSKAPIARLADRIAARFVPVVLVIALVAGLAWWALDPSGGLAQAVERMVAVLVIACPCALGLATPAAVAAGTGRGAELGVLIKGGGPLEAASHIDTVLLDKTGTLTTGKPTLTDVVALTGEADALLRLVAAAERPSEHPVGRAIVAGAARLEPLPSAHDFRVHAGGGVRARVDGHEVCVGTARWLLTLGVDASPLEPNAELLAQQGRTPSFVTVDGRLAGLVAVADQPSAGARAAVDALHALGMRVVMVTGDRRATAEAVAKTLGIAHVHAEVRPEDKAAVVQRERAAGRRVAMVGDGINDAPALAAADIGVAMGQGADIALDAADIALLGDGIDALPVALRLARATMRTIRQNLFWAFVYNLIGIPLAAGVFYPLTGWLLTPMFASAAMSLSSVSVLANSLRLRRFDR